jgi:Phytochelatin synthase
MIAGASTTVSQNLVEFTSEAGADLLIHAEARAAYWPLAAQFITQENPAFCGVASLVMVMNALRIPPPAAKETSLMRPSRKAIS